MRDKQLEEFLTNKEKQIGISEQKNDQIIDEISKASITVGGKPIKNIENNLSPALELTLKIIKA